MKRRKPTFRLFLLISMFAALMALCSSCKSEGEKLADEAIWALNKGDLTALFNCQFRYNSLSQREKERADVYFVENEPLARVRIMRLLEKRLKDIKLKLE